MIAWLVINFRLIGTGGDKMTIQRIGSTEGLKDVFGVKVVPVISLVVVHNGICQHLRGYCRADWRCKSTDQEGACEHRWASGESWHRQIETLDRPSMAGGYAGL